MTDKKKAWGRFQDMEVAKIDLVPPGEIESNTTPEDREAGGPLMPSFTVHFDKVDGHHYAVAIEAATADDAIAEVRHDILRCFPDGTAPEVLDAQFCNFTGEA